MSEHDDIDLLIDTDPIALGVRCRKAEVRLAEVEQALDVAERRVKVREDQVGVWKTLLYRRPWGGRC